MVWYRDLRCRQQVSGLFHDIYLDISLEKDESTDSLITFHAKYKAVRSIITGEAVYFPGLPTALINIASLCPFQKPAARGVKMPVGTPAAFTLTTGFFPGFF
jgi:hypothetical protein